MIDDIKKENEAGLTDAGESAEAVTDASEAAASLSINDLANIKQIIDVASARGAFKANEFNVVGITYDRLVAFLQSVMPKQEPDADATSDDVTADDTAEA